MSEIYKYASARLKYWSLVRWCISLTLLWFSGPHPVVDSRTRAYSLNENTITGS